MKINHYWKIVIMVGVIGGQGWFFPAYADLSLSPGQLTVVGAQGDIAVRTLLLKTSKPLTNVKIIVSDLNRVDGKTVFPAGAIQADIAESGAGTDGVIPIIITLELAKSPCGEFKGELLLLHQEGSLSVPCLVQVKTGIFFPLLVLISGVALSFLVTHYRLSGRPRDEIMVRIAQLNTQIGNDKEFPSDFRGRVEALIMDAEASLSAEKWSEAHNAVQQADNLLLKWRKMRSDWQEQFAFMEQLKQLLKQMGSRGRYALWMERKLRDLARNAADQASPETFGTQLSELAERLNQYWKLKVLLDEMGELKTRLTAETAETEKWRVCIMDLEHQLNELTPEQEAEYNTLWDTMKQYLASLHEDVVKSSQSSSRGVLPEPQAWIPPPPAASGFFLPENDQHGARIRLKLFTFTTYGIALIFLTGIGFGELYLRNPIFGVEPWSDYFTLLAWGFGAEASRAAITDMVKGWGLRLG